MATADVMREHRKSQVAQQLAAGPFWDGRDELVFRAEGGAARYPDTVSALMRQLVAKAGLPPARLHDLREICQQLGNGLSLHTDGDLIVNLQVVIDRDEHLDLSSVRMINVKRRMVPPTPIETGEDQHLSRH